VRNLKNNWSVSRDRVLNSCERQYYYTYVASARINSKNPQLKEIALLKKLTNIPMWQGELFHDIVATSLNRIKRGESLLSDTWLRTLKKKVKTEWDFSANRSIHKNPELINKAGGLALFEHEYDHELEDKNPDSIVYSIELLINRFITWAEQIELKKIIKESRHIWIEPQIYGTNVPGFVIDDVQVIAKVDLAFVNTDRKFIIFDWKTGKSSKVPGGNSQGEFQMRVYQLWSHLTLKYPLESIEAHLVYFGSDPVSHEIFQIDMEQCEFAISLIRSSIARTIRFNNKDDKSNKLNQEDFDFANSAKICQYCKFKRLCQRSIEI
jgi:PD-(D/E)XK nuclease superfamily